MTPRNFGNLAQRLMEHPTAPYHEHAVRDEVQKICAEHNVLHQLDAFGNLIVRLGHQSGGRPIVLAAHLDHPGFEILKQLSPRRWVARFRGGVADTYFREGTPLVLMPGCVEAVLGRRKDKAERIFEVKANTVPKVPARFAVWDLVDYRADGSHI